MFRRELGVDFKSHSSIRVPMCIHTLLTERLCGLTENLTAAELVSGVWQSMSVLQLSRRSNRWDAEVDTAATKLAKVLDWFRAL